MSYFLDNPFAANVIQTATQVQGNNGVASFVFPGPATSGEFFDCSQFQGMRLTVGNVSNVPGVGVAVLINWADDKFPLASLSGMIVGSRMIVLGSTPVGGDFTTFNNNLAVTMPHLGDFMQIIMQSTDGVSAVTLDWAASQRQNGVMQWAPYPPQQIGPPLPILGPVTSAVANGATNTITTPCSAIYAGPAHLDYDGPGGGVGSSVVLEYLNPAGVWQRFARVGWVAPPSPFAPLPVFIPPAPIRAKLTNGSGNAANMDVTVVADDWRAA